MSTIFWYMAIAALNFRHVWGVGFRQKREFIAPLDSDQHGRMNRNLRL